MRGRVRAGPVLIAMAMLSLADCNLDDPGCSYGTFRCRGDVLEVCGSSNQWIEYRNCATLDPPEVCREDSCQPAP